MTRTLQGGATGGGGTSAPNASTLAPGLVQLAGDLAGTATAPTVAKINGAAPAPIATSGKYADLSGAPALAAVATSGAASDLAGLATVATTGSYGSLTGRPLLATVATSGSYNDLANKPAIPTGPTPPTVTTSGAVSYWKNAENVVTVNLNGVAGSNTSGATLFTLPAGYRPAAALSVPVVGWNGATTYSAFVVSVQTTGVIAQNTDTLSRGGQSIYADFSFVAA